MRVKSSLFYVGKAKTTNIACPTVRFDTCMHVPLDERDKAWKSRVVSSKRRMEEEVREVAGRRVGDGEGLKKDIKEPICQKCKFSPPTETKQGAFDIEK